MATNVRAMKMALETLEEHNVVQSFDDSERIKDGKKLKDIVYKIYPTEEFVKIIKKANYKSSINQAKKAIASGKKPEE